MKIRFKIKFTFDMDEFFEKIKLIEIFFISSWKNFLKTIISEWVVNMDIGDDNDTKSTYCEALFWR